MAGFVVINRKVVNFSSKADSKANGRHYRKKNTLKVFFSRSLFSQKYIAENFLRGQSFHSASFLIDFLSKFLSLYFCDKLTSRAGGLGEFAVHEIMIIDIKSEMLIHIFQLFDGELALQSAMQKTQKLSPQTLSSKLLYCIFF